MTQIIAPPFKVQLSENLTISDLIDGTRGDVVASEKAVGALRASVAGSSENLLINPRGRINQVNDAQGVIPANTYFCDGWKSGATGAEVYVDSDGFRLVSGSIKQLVPNNLEENRPLRANFDVISGAPQLSINGGTNSEVNNAAEYIELEIAGDNSKFTRIILAESEVLPIYRQLSNELTSCLPMLEIIKVADYHSALSSGLNGVSAAFKAVKIQLPAVTRTGNAFSSRTEGTQITGVFTDGIYMSKSGDTDNYALGGTFLIDARP